MVPIHDRYVWIVLKNAQLADLYVSLYSHWYLAIVYRPEFMLPYHQSSPSSPNPHESAESQDTAIDISGKDTSINGPRTVVYILDSLGGHHPRVTSRISSYLQLEASLKFQCSNTSSAIERYVKVSFFLRYSIQSDSFLILVLGASTAQFHWLWNLSLTLRGKFCPVLWQAITGCRGSRWFRRLMGHS